MVLPAVEHGLCSMVFLLFFLASREGCAAGCECSDQWEVFLATRPTWGAVIGRFAHVLVRTGYLCFFSPLAALFGDRFGITVLEKEREILYCM